jgi:hypothetical protein
MPFYIYRTESDANGKVTRYVKEKPIPLAGKTGPLYSHFCKIKGITNVDEFPWDITDVDIISELGYQEPQGKVIIIDMKPRVKGNVALYRLMRIWGITCRDWTPLALQLKTIYDDLEHPDPDSFKRDFPEMDSKGALVHEFLYLQGGSETGKWTWGSVGGASGALLWPSALNHFIDCIQPYTK